MRVVLATRLPLNLIVICEVKMDCTLCPILLFLFKTFSEQEQIRRIKEETAMMMGVRVEELAYKSRKQRIVQARRVAMIRCRQETTATLEEIGNAFDRNHSTVLYNITDNKSFKKDVAKDRHTS